MHQHNNTQGYLAVLLREHDAITYQLVTTIHSDSIMGKSKAQECTARGTVHLVKWRPKKTTRGLKARWVPDKRTNPSKSVQLSPTKSPAKQPSDRLMYRFSEDFEVGYDDQGSINPMQLPTGLGKNKNKKKTMASTSPLTFMDVRLASHRIPRWKLMTGDYLEILLEREGPPADRKFISGMEDKLAHTTTGTGRTPMMGDHLLHPPAAGTPGACETGDLDSEGPSASAYTGVPQDVDDMGERDIFLENESPAYPNDFPAVGKTQITVVDTSGVHTVSIRFCQCVDARRPDKQLFEMGLFPASFTRPKTAFTFGLLDDFILDNLEYGTSAMNYYSKLRRITSSVFPHLVPDRYRELMRVARQWRQLKLLKWNGFGHDRRDPKDGELALFCPACPQPSINVTLPTQDDETTPGWLYSHSLVMDGNFKAEHLHPAHPEDEVWLTDGQSFMVARARYQAHLGMAKDSAQRSECNNHRAVNQANASWHKLEATGIGGCACARHGCFVPNSMVDFQKGERQMNMDYALCNALSHNTDGLHRALTFYDVNCQYNKHLRQRVDESLHLSIPPGMDIIPGIGLWHIHGHQDKCYVRIDREIMETLWAPLNIISPSARGMSTLHRQECLDYRMNNCNFMKMIRMYPEMVERWEAQEGAAQASRMNDPSALDLYDIQLQKGKSGLLQHSIDEFIAAAGRYLGEGYDADDCIPDMDIEFLDDGPDGGASTDEDIEDVRDLGDNHPKGLFRPEMVVIPLPSNLGIYRCEELGTAGLVRQETTLREGQANDMLHAIRVHLADKAVLFRTTIRPAKSQARTTRAWAQVHSVEWVINLNSMIYKKCRAQLSNLGADQLLEKYRVLEKSDLKATSAVADPNARGQRNSTLPWFWSLDVQGDSVSNDWMNEFYRVHWLRTKALHNHWVEEILLVGHEMRWTIDFLVHRSRTWLGRANQNGDLPGVGRRCYAIRQAQMYRQLAEDAHARFAEVNPTFGHN
ncbi:hypothetical protein DFH29DRAFT_876211 [Suillus ampliporus]|nr:hypothetical protein DFH29DRAFT_876211 [Suillus ampliporus]